MAARQAAEEYQLLMKLAEFDRREGWVGVGNSVVCALVRLEMRAGDRCRSGKVRVARRLEAQRTALIEATRDAAETSPEPQMTNADALAAVARAALTTTGKGHGNLPAVVLHVDAAALPDDGPGRCHLQDGPGIPPATARRLSCDAVLLQLLAHLDGSPSEPGTRTQAIAPAQRRALWSRDGGCRFPG